MIKLFRDQCGPSGTLGYLDLDTRMPPARERIFTLERPWIPLCTEIEIGRFDEPANFVLPPCGQKGVSCIPPGIYDLVPHSSEAHPDTFALVNPDLWVYHFDTDVPFLKRGIARTAILIHPANFVEELRGCIAPGMTRNIFPISPNVGSSRAAFALLRPFLKDAKQIEIVQL